MIHVIKWVNPTQNEDGTPYNQTDNAGYTLQLDGQGAVSIPLAWGTEFDMAPLTAFQALKAGSHTATLAAVNTDGVQSDFGVAATFRVFGKPKAVTNIVVE